MSTNSTCDTMLIYSTSTYLKISLLLNWFILLPSFPIIGYAFNYCLSNRIFHRNTQFQIIIHLAALLIHCFGRFVLHSADLFNYFYPYKSGCDILPNFYRCLIFRFLYNAGQALVSMTPISITIERIIAIGYNRAYENCAVHYGWILGAFQIILAIGYLITRYMHTPFNPSSFTFYYCQTLSSSTNSTAETMIPLVMVIVCQMLSILIFKFLEIKNKKLRAVSDISLSTRYTLDQSKRSFVALKTFMHFNCITISLILMGLLTLKIFSSHFTKPNYMAIIELTHAIPLYGISICIGVWWKLRLMDGETRRNITLALRGQTVHTDLYFQMFENQLKR